MRARGRRRCVAPLALSVAVAACGGDPAPPRNGVVEAITTPEETPSADRLARLRKRVSEASAREDAGAEVRALEELIAAEPGNPDTRSRLGTLLIDRKQHSSAVEHLRAAIRLRGKDPQSSMALVFALQSHGRFEEAIEVLNKMKAHREGPEPGARLGWIHLARGDLEAAGSEFDEALESWPTCASARAGKAALLRRAGGLAESRELLEETADYAPKNAQVHYELALTYRALGDDPAARRAMSRFEEIQQEKPTTFSTGL